MLLPGSLLITIKMATVETVHIEVTGLLGDISFHRAKCCAEDLDKDQALQFTMEVTGLLEFEWDMYIDNKKKEIKGEAWVFEDKAIIFINGEMIGGPKDFVKWAEIRHAYEDWRPLPLYYTISEQAYVNYLNSTGHEFVFMELTAKDEKLGKLVIELFTDVVPKTCANFKALCTGEKGVSPKTEHPLHFKGTFLHRIVKNGWIQGGDIWKPCSGDGGESIYGPVFEDENFAIKHDKRGILGMANKGRHTNSSQFYITLQPARWMNTKYVAFGQVIEGTKILKKLEELGTINERPLHDVKIVDCGVLTYQF